MNNILSHSLWAVCGYRNPTRWKKLTTWWPGCTHKISCHSSRIGLKGVETNWPWNRRLTAPKATTMTPVRSLMTYIRMTIRASCAVSACSPLSVFKSCCHWLSVYFPHPPLLYLPTSKIKQTFLFTKLASLRSPNWPLSGKQTDPTFGYSPTVNLHQVF